MADSSGPPSAPRRAITLLAAGACAGLAVAAVGLMTPDAELADGLPEGAVAAVNGRIVRVESYQRAIAALASDRREPIGEAERRHVLDRLLDEELLVQRGLELGLALHDRRVRGDIVSAVIQAVVSQTEAEALSDAELRDFYEENRDYFTRTGRLLVEQILVRGRQGGDEAEARTRAEQAARRLREGEPIERVDADLGDAQVARIPRDYLPATKLREYVGPTATRRALDLAPGEVSDPVRSATGYHVLRLVDRSPGRVPTLAEIEDEVRAEARRRAGDRALREYLDDLRGRADVRVAKSLP